MKRVVLPSFAFTLTLELVPMAVSLSDAQAIYSRACNDGGISSNSDVRLIGVADALLLCKFQTCFIVSRDQDDLTVGRVEVTVTTQLLRAS